VVSTALKNGRALSCAKGLGSGFWDATVGIAIDVGEGLGEGGVKLLTAPNKLWADIVTSYRNMVNLLSNLNDAISSAFSVYKTLPTDKKAKIVCGMIGSTTTSGIIAYFAPAAGAPIFLKALAKTLREIGKATKNASLLRESDRLFEKAHRLKVRHKTARVVSAENILDDIKGKYRSIIKEAKFRLEDAKYKLRTFTGLPGPGNVDDTRRLIKRRLKDVRALEKKLKRMILLRNREMSMELAALRGDDRTQALAYAITLGYVGLQPCAATKPFREETAGHVR